ncbi:MAG TPA: PD-(D/E)XK nuclease family protein [Bryobacteraceae bacterium]|nr:PD-(D/E)XK nuclease family protein [Bryobacteraceae bacterium]
MQLLTGPAGSGKTFSALETLREALHRGETSVRLLVPTATMAQHLRDELAREGLVFSPRSIQTISRFIESWVADVPEVSSALFTVLVERTVHRLNLPEFQKVAHCAGLHARLAAVIDECASAACDARLLREHLTDGLGRAVARVFDEISGALKERRLALRSTRLSLAAARVEETGLGAAKTIWLDGFFSLTDPEIALVQAMAKHADVTVTLPTDGISAATRARLLSIGFKERRLTRQRVPPARELVVAPGTEREVDEIARRILEQVESGRLFREMSIIVRAPDIYARLLRATLERFGIPAKFYFDLVLTEQPAVRYLTGVIDAMLGGWQLDETLTVMKLAPGAGFSLPMDRFDFDVRKRMPGAGLGALRELAAAIESADRRLGRLLDSFSEVDKWRTLRWKPAEWGAQLAGLRALYRPSRLRDGVGHETVLEWRSQAQALDVLEKAVIDAGQAFDASIPLSLDEFWPAVKALLRLTPLRLIDQRRNVVHVLSAYEARQWELPVVFVCGLVEGQFPRYQAPDPFLPQHMRRRLKERGLRIRTTEDIENEERFLFDSALHRATASVVMSYPKNDARAELNLPSLFLDAAQVPTESRTVRVRIAQPSAATTAAPIRSPDLLQILQQKHNEMRPTALETYFQCPFQFFGRHTLKLDGAPVRPEKRLDFRLRGTIVHQVIKEWLEARGPIEPIFERVFVEFAQKEFVVSGYETEFVRAQMLDDLRCFATAERWPADCHSQAEASCRFELEDGLMIRCRVDRLLQDSEGRAFVIDYKYSSNLREYAANEDRLQGPLYWLAAERGFQLSVAGVYYCSLRDGIRYAGWGEKPDWLKAKVEPFTPDWLATAVERSMLAARAIAQGRVAPEPSDLGKCRYCDFRDACRYAGAEAAIAECAE